MESYYTVRLMDCVKCYSMKGGEEITKNQMMGMIIKLIKNLLKYNIGIQK